MTEKLRKWAAIDIETTGMDPGSDDIIDIGYYLFEGFELKKKFSSLCKTEQKLSPFITQLTGIKNSDLVNAPRWSEIESEISKDLAGATLLAHNSEFEKNFLSSKIPAVSFVDSLSLFPFLHLNSPSLSLESILRELKLSHKEEHRGLSDARDMLRALMTHFLENGENLNRLYSIIGKMEVIHPDLDFFVRWGEWPRESLVELLKSLNSEVLYPYQIDGSEVEEENKKSKVVEISGEISRENLLEHFSYNPSYQWLATKIAQSLIKNIHAGIQMPIENKLIEDVLEPILNKFSGTSVIVDLEQRKNIKVNYLPSPVDSFCELKFQDWNPGNISSFEDQWINLFMHFLVLGGNDITTQSIPGVLYHRFSTLKHKLNSVTLGSTMCSGSSCSFFEKCGYAKNLEKLKNEKIIHASLQALSKWPLVLPKYQRIIVLNADRLEEAMTKIHTKEVDWAPTDEEQSKTLQRLKSEPKYHYLYGLEKEKSEDKIHSEVEYYELNRDDEIRVFRTSYDISKKSWEHFFADDQVTSLLLSPFYREDLSNESYLNWVSGYSLIKNPARRYQNFQSYDFGQSLNFKLENYSLDDQNLTEYLKKLDLEFNGHIYYYSEYKKNKELLQAQISELGVTKNKWEQWNGNTIHHFHQSQPAILIIGKIPDFSMKFVYQKRRDWIKQNKIFANEFQDYFMCVRCLKLMQIATQYPFVNVIAIDDRTKQWKHATWDAWENNIEKLHFL